MGSLKNLILTVGLPRSGKSTWVDKVIKGEEKIKELDSKTLITVVCPDDIRMALCGQPFLLELEPVVWATVATMINTLFRRYDVVILDATNTTQLSRNRWVSKKWNTHYKLFNDSEEECVDRCGDNETLKGVIEKMRKNCQDLTTKECRNQIR